MSDFLTRAAMMALGVGPSVKPLIASRYAPNPEAPLREIDAVFEDTQRGYNRANQAETRPASLPVARPKSEPPVSGTSEPGHEVREVTPAEPPTPSISEIPLDTHFQPPLRQETLVAKSQTRETSLVETPAYEPTIARRGSATLDEVTPPHLVESNSVEERSGVSRSESDFIPAPAADSRAFVAQPPQASIISDDQERITHTTVLSDESPVAVDRPRSVPDDLPEVSARSIKHVSEEVRTTERVVDSINTTTLVPTRERPFAEISDWRPREQTTQAAPAAPVVRVTIGRIEVQAAPSPVPAVEPPAPAGPKMSLDEYLRQYNGRRHNE